MRNASTFPVERHWGQRVRLLLAAGALACLLPAQSYQYDAAGRLIRVAYPQGGGIAYTYDASDNMTSATPLHLAAAPSGLQIARLSPAEARISWQASEQANGYVIERRREGTTVWEQIAIVSGGATTFIDTNLEPGVRYSYRIAASTADGRGAFSAEAGFPGPQRPIVAEGGIVNGASFAVGRPIAPGSLVTLFGANLGQLVTESGVENITELATETPLPTKLGGYEVLFNAVKAPLLFVGSGQINAQVPWEVTPGAATVTVRQETPGGVLESEPREVRVALLSPGFFTFSGDPTRVVAVNVKVREDDGVIHGSVAQPAGVIPGIPAQPAPLGGVVLLYATGLGPVAPAPVTGANSLDALRNATILPRVTVGDAQATVEFAGLAPEFAGVFQLNVTIPLGAVPGEAAPIRMETGGLTSQDGVTIALRPPN